MTTEIFVEYTEYAICAILGAQFAYGLTIFLLSSVMMEYYEWGTFKNPTNRFQKSVNFGTALFFGLGYFVYKRLYKYNWFLRKLYFLLFLVVSGILSVFIILIVSDILHYIFKV
ncbi:hypothetical protein HOO54_04325 [Bacillus sp. WMMC1349]|uniref:hypothetical protein n=1 Tax=Bacillus sp. WMMC1349 TaxID=2736254 RepID=UPI001555B501|nr:hypothetical protein [Bacillus sp. WMMC1349]NPC91491.1 hypothetical protein [Bacillus sp. WMMC1349]